MDALWVASALKGVRFGAANARLNAAADARIFFRARIAFGTTQTAYAENHDSAQHVHASAQALRSEFRFDHGCRIAMPTHRPAQPSERTPPYIVAHGKKQKGALADALRFFLDRYAGAYPTHTRALRNMRIHGESPVQSRGAQLRLALRRVRSGCGIRMVARPSR